MDITCTFLGWFKGIVISISAETADGIIMGPRHRKLRVEGVQFHPESVLAGAGFKLLENFLSV